jgi:hypothetical protein
MGVVTQPAQTNKWKRQAGPDISKFGTKSYSIAYSGYFWVLEWYSEPMGMVSWLLFSSFQSFKHATATFQFSEVPLGNSSTSRRNHDQIWITEMRL